MNILHVPVGQSAAGAAVYKKCHWWGRAPLTLMPILLCSFINEKQ